MDELPIITMTIPTIPVQPKSYVSPETNWSDVGKGVAVGAGTAGVGYLIYRGIRMIPSILLPQLWWTIPTNAAMP